jgi:hypothetical protein
MKRFTVLGASVLLLSGCALPVPIQIASWALDGLSYLTTEKSVADHGLSIIAQQDCAILRGLLAEGDFCHDFDDPATVVADADSGPANAFAANDETAGSAVLGDGADIADFETAAGTVSDSSPLNVEGDIPLMGYPLEIGGEEVEDEDAPAIGDRIAAMKTAGKKETLGWLTVKEWQAEAAWMTEAIWMTKVSLDVAASPTRATDPAAEPAAGFYFVIGSFRELLNARKLRDQHQALTPSVLAAKLEHGTVFRVVVGPFVEDDAKRFHKAIFRAGIADSWAIQVKPGEWSMAMVEPPAVSAAKAPVLVLVTRSSEKREVTSLD